MLILIGLCVVSLAIVACVVILIQSSDSDNDKSIGVYLSWLVIGAVVAFTIFVTIRYVTFAPIESLEQLQEAAKKPPHAVSKPSKR